MLSNLFDDNSKCCAVIDLAPAARPAPVGRRRRVRAPAGRGAGPLTGGGPERRGVRARARAALAACTARTCAHGQSESGTVGRNALRSAWSRVQSAETRLQSAVGPDTGIYTVSIYDI